MGCDQSCKSSVQSSACSTASKSQAQLVSGCAASSGRLWVSSMTERRLLLTLTPLLVELDHLVHQTDISKAAPLRLAQNLRVATLLYIIISAS